MPVMKSIAAKTQALSAGRTRIVASALASMRIEGLELDSRAAADFVALQAGSVSSAELRERFLQRYTKQASAR